MNIKLYSEEMIERNTHSRRYRGYFDIFKCVLVQLSQGSSKKTHILNRCNLNSSTAAKYLKMLENGGAVSSKKIGREIYYSLTDKGMLALLAMKALYKLLLSSDSTLECKEEIRRLLEAKGYEYLENAYLASPSGIQLPVSFYIPRKSKAIVIVESSDNELVLLYSALIQALMSELKSIGEVLILSPSEEGLLGNLFVQDREKSISRMRFVGGCSKALLENLV